MPTLPKAKTVPQAKTELIEVKPVQIAKLSEQLGILNEVIVKRQEEADVLRHELVQTQTKISLATSQWEQKQALEKERMALWKRQQEEAVALQQNDLAKTLRQAQGSLQRTQAFEEEIRLRLLELNAKDQEFRTLSQDRIDTGRLRTQAQAKMQEAQALLGKAMDEKNQASAAMIEAKAIQADCEARNQRMQEAWNKCRAWEEELRLRARDVEIREQELKRQALEHQGSVIVNLTS